MLRAHLRCVETYPGSTSVAQVLTNPLFTGNINHTHCTAHPLLPKTQSPATTHPMLLRHVATRYHC
jgi:hypothetical protein